MTAVPIGFIYGAEGEQEGRRALVVAGISALGLTVDALGDVAVGVADDVDAAGQGRGDAQAVEGVEGLGTGSGGGGRVHAAVDVDGGRGDAAAGFVGEPHAVASWIYAYLDGPGVGDAGVVDGMGMPFVDARGRVEADQADVPGGEPQAVILVDVQVCYAVGADGGVMAVVDLPSGAVEADETAAVFGT